MLFALVLSQSYAQAPGPHAAQMAQFGPNAHHWVLAARPPVPPVAKSAAQKTVYGYHPYWGDDPTQLDFDRLTDLAIFEVGINSDGSLSYTSRWTDVAPAVIPLAHAHGVRVHLCAISFDSSVQSAVLTSASRRATLIANLKNLVEQYGGDGVNIDIEGLSGSLRADMVTFLQELDAQVEDVWVATPAIDWSNAFDEAAMSQLSGGMFIMGYGYHWTGGDPGSNDPLYGGSPWSSYSLQKTIETYVADGADLSKVVIGLPLYGQEWPANSSVPGSATGSGWSVVMDEAEGIAAAEGQLYDTVTHSPYVLRNGTQLWYDDNAAVQERIHWAVGAGLAGVGFWALTYEGNDPAFWDMVEAETKIELPDTGGGGDSGPQDSGPQDSAAAGHPVARAGQTLEVAVGDTVYLNGTGSSDPMDYPLRYMWTVLSGPGITLEDADTAEPHFVVPEAGSWTFQLVVESKHGLSQPDTVEIIAVEHGGCSTGAQTPVAWGAVLGLAGLLGLAIQRRRA